MPEPLPGQRRGHEAGCAVRQISAPCLYGKARPGAPPGNTSHDSVTRPRISVSALVRLAIAATLVGYLLRRSNPQDVWHALAHATTAPLLIAVALVLLDRAVMAYRWFVLLGPLEGQQLP